MNASTRTLIQATTLGLACLLAAACQGDRNQPVVETPPQAAAEPAAPTDPATAPADLAAVETPAEPAPPPVAPVAPAAPATPATPAPAPAAPAPAPKPAAPATPAVQYAQVVSVTPVRQSQDNPQEVCHDVEVVYQVEPKDEHKIAGTAIGAIVGGAIGNQVGDGRGRDAARVAGAIAGGVAGRKIQENQQNKKTETRIERQCEIVNDPTFTTVAYDIVYSYAGQTHSARVAEDPGERIRLPVRSIDE